MNKAAIPKFQSQDFSIPSIGLGTWKAEPGVVSEAVIHAISDFGYRHIDCAKVYRNEHEIGHALQRVITQGTVDREELFITSKLWNTDHHPDDVERACRKTLSDLQLEQLDLYLMHWGTAFAPSADLYPQQDGMTVLGSTPLHKTWEAMEQLVKKGLVKNIGVANFSAPLLRDLLNYASIAPVVNQIEIHPYLPQFALVDFCRQQSVIVTAYSPLGSSKDSLKKPLTDEVVTGLASEYGKSPAQILLRWLFQRQIVSIPKSTNPLRLKENMSIFDFELSPESMAKIAEITHRERYIDPSENWRIPYFS